MSKFFVIFSALLLVQLSVAARIVREAPQTETHVPTLSEVIEKAQSTFQTINADFLKVMGLESNEQLIQKIQTETKTLVDTAKSQFDELEKKVNNEKTQEFVKNVKTQLDELVKDNPAITQDAKVFHERFQHSFQKVVKETERFGAKLNKEGATVGEDVTKLLKTIVDSSVDAAKKLTEKQTP